MSARREERPVVLYVDDERNNRVVFQHTFADQFDVLLAESGQEALEVLASRTVDVLLADQRMPGMTGVELAQAAKARHPQVKRVLVTAYVEDPGLAEALEDGTLQRLLGKPWVPEQIVEVVRRSSSG